MKSNIIKSTTHEDYHYICHRCEKDSEMSSMCPCPRGGCEAKIVGLKTTTSVIVKLSKQKQDALNR